MNVDNRQDNLREWGSLLYTPTPIRAYCTAVLWCNSRDWSLVVNGECMVAEGSKMEDKRRLKASHWNYLLRTEGI